MFKVGDKVVCIKDSDVGRSFNIPKNKVYTVIEATKLLIMVDGIFGSFYAHRFALVEEGFEEITPVIRKIREMTQRRASYAAI
jgi:hypothetical protein